MIYEAQKKSRFEQKIFFVRIEIGLKINPIFVNECSFQGLFVYKITKKGKKSLIFGVFIG